MSDQEWRAPLVTHPTLLAVPPQLERLEPDRCPLGIGAGADGAVDGADGVQAHLQWVLDGKLDVPNGEPTRAIGAAEGVRARTQPLQAQEDALGGQADAADDEVLVLDAAATSGHNSSMSAARRWVRPGRVPTEWVSAR
jgi:hypothetical protein